MPKITHKNLRPYLFHGMDLEEGDREATGDCPFCGRDGKFSVSIETGQWQCFVCKAGTDRGGGNAQTFIRLLQESSFDATSDYNDIASNRTVSPETLIFWGVCRSILTDDWLVPGYSADGKIGQLYRYLKDKVSGRMRLLPTPELGHAIHGVPLYDKSKPVVYVCEGPWDGLALWETLRAYKLLDDELVPTANEASSLLASCNVLSVPSCGAVGEPFKKWLPLFAGKQVVLCFDSDHPKEHNGKETAAGLDATKRAVSILASDAAMSPASISYLKWGSLGYDPSKHSGYDVRDALNAGPAKEVALAQLLILVEPIPADWLAGRSQATVHRGGTEIELTPCRDWATLRTAWQKAMKWIDGLDYALSVMLSVVASTRIPHEQLWVEIISPPSTGKTQLCDALGINRKYVKSVGNFSGFHSGFQSDKEGAEDHSLLSQLKDKTLVVKDGDTILKSPNRERILAQARDAYDTNCSVAYANRVKREYYGLRFGFILCGTEAILEMDSADLGARFLSCIIMHTIDEDLESSINQRGFHRILRNRGIEANGDISTHDDPAILEAKRLTGGYVSYLRENANVLLDRLDMSNSEELSRDMDNLAQFVAFMRARQAKKQDEVTTREMSARLNSQLTKLSLCMAVVLNKTSVDAEVMKRVKKVALDTARGKTLNIVKQLALVGTEGIYMASLSHLLTQEEENIKKLMVFMRRIGIVERFEIRGSGVVSTRGKWRLTPRMRRLYESVIGDKV